MPRKARPIPTQQFPTGLPYGERQRLEQQAAALPTPNAGGGDPMVAQIQAQIQAQQGSRLDQIAKQGWDVPAVTPLSAPSQRPGEPVTAGLAIGAGPGPEILPQFKAAPLSNFLMTLANATGDQSFVELANADQTSRTY